MHPCPCCGKPAHGFGGPCETCLRHKEKRIVAHAVWDAACIGFILVISLGLLYL